MSSSFVGRRTSGRLSGRLSVPHCAAVLLLGLLGFSSPTGALYASELQTVEALLTSDLLGALNNGAPGTLGASYGATCNPCTLGDAYGALVRLAFHDAGGQGRGMNGCIDFVNTGDNKGLGEIVDAIAVLRSRLITTRGITLSNADLFVIAANLAVRFATTPVASPRADLPPVRTPLQLPLRVGRVDAPACNDAGMLPPPTFSWNDTYGLFSGRFGCSEAETLALLGAHALGRAEAANSGFEGGWVDTASSFSNSYFSALIVLPWDEGGNATPGGANNYFNAGVTPQTIMLRSDVETLLAPSGGCKRFDVRASAYQPAPAACPFNSAPIGVGAASVSDLLFAFANGQAGQELFFSTFASAWQKLTEENVAGNLSAVLPDPSGGAAGAAVTYSSTILWGSVASAALGGGALALALLCAVKRLKTPATAAAMSVASAFGAGNSAGSSSYMQLSSKVYMDSYGSMADARA